MQHWLTPARLAAGRVRSIRHRRFAAAGAVALVAAALLGAGLAAPRLAPPTPAAPGSGSATVAPPGATALAAGALPQGTAAPIQGVIPASSDDSPFAVLGTPAPTPTPGLLRPTKHRVVEGETLVSIADRYGLRPETLVWANDITNADLIVVGQELVIPPTDGIFYTVQPGERLVDIAERYGADLEQVVVANGLSNADFVLAGQSVFLPGARPLAPPAPSVVQEPPGNAPVQAAELESLPITPELQAVLDAGWERATADLQLYSGPGPDSRVLGPIPAGARLERIGSLQGRRLPVRDPGDGQSRLAMTGWVDALSLEPAPPPRPSELPRSYPDNTRMDIFQVFAPYRSQLDGSAYSLANCGPTVLSMALAAFGVDASPGQLRPQVQAKQHIWGNNVGSLITALAQVANDYGLRAEGLFDGDQIHRWTLDELRAHLAQRHPIIVQVRYRALPGRERVPYYGDHYLLLTGILDDAFLYNDPINHDGVGWDRVISGERLYQAMDASDRRYAYAAFAVSRGE